jgi:ribosomal protein S18 acetylase RimI-like enzyme
MDIVTRLATKDDLPKYTNLLQRTYQDAYTCDDIGLTKECFSREIFNTQNTQEYLASNLKVDEKQKCWLVFSEQSLVGAITIAEKVNDCEVRGFYVAPEYQNKGIGEKLWKLALNFAKGKDITLDIYAHNKKGIEIYKKWGFEVDDSRDEFYRHWPEWPEDVRAESIYMRYRNKINKQYG